MGNDSCRPYGGLILPDAFIRRSYATLHNLLIIHRPYGALMNLSKIIAILKLSYICR